MSAAAPWFPSDRTYLGDFTSCSPAVTQANVTHYPANGCAYCCPACHTSSFMPEMIGFRCNACDHGFAVKIFSKDEINRGQESGQSFGAIVCPQCGSDKV